MAKATKRLVATDADEITGDPKFSDNTNNEIETETETKYINPANIDNTATFEPQAKQRKKRGPNKPKGDKANAVSLASNLSTFIGAVGSALAAITKIPEFALEQTQCEALAKASTDVMAYHPNFIQLSGQATAYIMLSVAVGGTGIVQYERYKQRVKSEKHLGTQTGSAILQAAT